MIGGTVFHMLRCVTGLGVPQSQTTAGEREALQKYSRGKRRGVEIGVYEGVTTCLIAGELAGDGVLYSIDPFLKGRLGICWGKLIATTMIRRSGLRERVRLVEKYSYEAADCITGQFDFVFVDGDHSLQGISRDWADWSKRVSPGGVLALHDTHAVASNPDVAGLGSVEYFDSQIRHDGRFEIVEQVDSLSVLVRRGETC